MGYKEIPGGVQAMAHEDGKFRIGLRNLPPDSDRFVYKKDKQGNKLNEWPEFVIRKGFAGPERRMILPEAVMKAHGKIPPSANVTPDDFESKSGSKVNFADSRIDNVIYKPSEHGNSPYKGKPEKKSSAPKKEDTPTGEPEPQQSNDESTQVAKEAESMSDIAKGSGELTAKEAIEIIDKYDFEELRDLNFYTEDKRDRGPRVTVKDAWENKKEEYESNE